MGCNQSISCPARSPSAPDEILPELIHDLLRRRCEHHYLLGLGHIALGYYMTAHVEMNVVGASETAVPHAVAEGYQRINLTFVGKRNAKRLSAYTSQTKPRT